MTGEEWRAIPEFPGYEASSLGRIVSYQRKKPVELVGGINRPNGYRTIHLRRDGVSVCQTLHRLIARTFLGPRPDGMEICHINGDRLDNRVSNLRYDSHSENVQDAIRHGTHHWASKTECPSGHLYSEENTYWHRNGRQCRICRRAHQQAWNARRGLRAAGIRKSAA